MAVCADSSKGQQLYINVCVRWSNFVWHLVSGLFLQHLLIVRLSVGLLFVFFRVMYMCWTVAEMTQFTKLIYIYDRYKLLKHCNFLLKTILLISLANNETKILFCSIVVKHSMLKEFGLFCLEFLSEVSLLQRSVVHWSVRSSGSRWRSFKYYGIIHPATQCHFTKH